MALTNTLTGYNLHPFYGTKDDVTKPYYERLQTTGSGATMGGLEIFADPAASDNFILDNVLVNLTLPSGNADVVLYAGTDVLCAYPTIASGNTVYNHSFGLGIQCGTTTTATVSLFISTATCTARFVATGWRKR